MIFATAQKDPAQGYSVLFITIFIRLEFSHKIKTESGEESCRCNAGDELAGKQNFFRCYSTGEGGKTVKPDRNLPAVGEITVIEYRYYVPY